jgi:hypothetical protein
MPYINARLDRRSAIIDVLVGVSVKREGVLRRNKLPVPDRIPVRALIDTGSDLTGFSPWLFTTLGISPIAKTRLWTPSTPSDAPFEADEFDVQVWAVANGTPHPFSVQAVAWEEGWGRPGVDGLLGCDFLAYCTFQYFGGDRTFNLGF